jgi:hypothetical protein
VNTAQLAALVRLRYKLMWAKTRSRNGRIALFFSGYMLLVMVFILSVSGGFGAGFAAVRTGQAELVARILFSAIFVQALIATITLGFGMNTVFSDVELRRYPVTAAERRLVRHFIGIADPFWVFFLLLEIGLVLALYIVGGTPLGMGGLAVLLLFVCNYLCARIAGGVIDRLMQQKSGGAILMVFILIFAFLPSILGTAIGKSPSMQAAAMRIFSFTPPFKAAAAATHWGATGFGALGMLLAWTAALVAVLGWVESRPPVVRSAGAGKVSWESWYERLGALFPPQDAPFVGYWLRFYMRNGRFRIMYLLTLPFSGFLIYNATSRPSEGASFGQALGIFTVVSFLATSRMAVNQYGYVGGGFRRFFLLPTDPVASLRAGAYASMLLGGAAIPFALIGWAILMPGGFDARKIAMLLGNGFAGLFFFHGLGLWVSMLNPRKGDFNGTFGNDLSLWGNIVVVGGMLTAIFSPKIVWKVAPALLSPGLWWVSILAVAPAILFFYGSLRAASPLLRSRREQLMAVVEGRD